MKTPKKLIFFGNERLATGVATTTPTLIALSSSGYEIAAVISSFSAGSSRSARPLEIAEAAKKLDIPLILPTKPIDIINQLSDYQAEAGVLVAFGKILPQEIIDIFPKGIINIHPSLLPTYRGPTPIETAILNGAKSTGVSLMKLTAEMDAGPVFAQLEVPLDGDETKQKLADKLLRLGNQLLLDNLDAILDGSLAPIDQDKTPASFTNMIKKSDGWIDWQNKTAEQIEREVRAYQSYPKSRTKIWDKHEIVITACRVVTSFDEKALIMDTKEGYLEILELTGPSGRKMSGADFKLGYRA